MVLQMLEVYNEKWGPHRSDIVFVLYVFFFFVVFVFCLFIGLGFCMFVLFLLFCMFFLFYFCLFFVCLFSFGWLLLVFVGVLPVGTTQITLLPCHFVVASCLFFGRGGVVVCN